MPETLVYEYVIIRVVPKVEREEFFNVGVLLYCKRKKFLEVKYHIDPTKLAVYGSELSLEALETHLQSWVQICQGAPKGGVIGRLDLPDRFRWLAACRSTVLQSSQTHSGLCDDPHKELALLFERFVL